MASYFRLRKLTVAMRSAEEWERRSNQVRSKLEEDQDELIKLQVELQLLINKLRSLSEKTEGDLTAAESVHQQHQVAIDELRNENKVNDATIKALVASGSLLLAKYDAETAVEVRRMVLVSDKRSEYD